MKRKNDHLILSPSQTYNDAYELLNSLKIGSDSLKPHHYSPIKPNVPNFIKVKFDLKSYRETDGNIIKNQKLRVIIRKK